MNRHRLAFRLRLRANRIDQIAWDLEKLAISTGSDPSLLAIVKRQRRIAQLLRTDAGAVKPAAKQDANA